MSDDLDVKDKPWMVPCTSERFVEAHIAYRRALATEQLRKNAMNDQYPGPLPELDRTQTEYNSATVAEWEARRLEYERQSKAASSPVATPVTSIGATLKRIGHVLTTAGELADAKLTPTLAQQKEFDDVAQELRNTYCVALNPAEATPSLFVPSCLQLKQSVTVCIVCIVALVIFWYRNVKVTESI